MSKFANCQAIEERIFIKYTPKNGLSSYNIRKIFQDKYGYMWFGTQEGLNRFDGKHFDIYKKNGPPKKRLLGIEVRDIFEDSTNNLLWVLPDEGGLNAISTITGNVVQSIQMESTSTEDWNSSMCFQNDKIWITSFSGLKVFDIKSGKFEKLNLHTSFKVSNPETSKIMSDKYGNLWVTVDKTGVWIINPQNKTIIKEIPFHYLNPNLPGESFYFSDIEFISPNTVLLGTSHGLYALNFDSYYSYDIKNFFFQQIIKDQGVSSVNKLSDSILFFASDKGLYKVNYNQQLFTEIHEVNSKKEENWQSTITDIFFDTKKNLWIGNQDGIAFSKNMISPFKSYSHDITTHFKIEHARSLFPVSDSLILVGLNNGLLLYNLIKQSFKKLDSSGWYQLSFKDNKNRIHSISDKGTRIVDGSSLLKTETIYPEFDPVKNYSLNSSIELGDSAIVLGTENEKGIVCWNYKKKTISVLNKESANNKLGANIVNTVFKDKASDIWILSDKIITLLLKDQKTVRQLQYPTKNEKNPYGIFFDICEAKGYYWIAAYGMGILQVNSDYNLIRIISMKDGLSNEGVYKVFNIGDSCLVITSNYGLSTLNINTNQFKNYYEEDGLHSNSFEEACGILYNGKIYAGGVNGFSVIDPKYFSLNNSPPVVYVRNIQIKTTNRLIDSSNIVLSSIKVPSNALQTTLAFSTLNYNTPQRTSLFYRIIEQSQEWLKAPDDNNITLIGLSYGTYHLQVRAFNEDGIPSDIKELTLIIQPKWHQTWWFKSSLSLLALFIIYLIYRIRLAQLKKEELIRRRIASDLHDDLGSTLNSIKVYTNLAIMEKDNHVHLTKIKEGTQDAITGVRDIIWVLDDKKDTVEHILQRINQFAAPLCNASNTRFTQLIDESAYSHKLAKKEKRNLYMILKEFINNSIKYAECTEITIKVNMGARRMRIVISDNGKGFDPKVTTEGNGVKNMKLRSKEIGYSIDITSSSQTGTAIILGKKY